MLSLASKQRGTMIALTAAFLLLSGTLLSGCAGTSGGQDGQKDLEQSTEVAYLTLNNLELERESSQFQVAQGANPWEIFSGKVPQAQEGSGAYELQGEKFRVKGLKDKDVEQKINQQIEAAEQELLTRATPRFRGIKTRISESTPIDSSNFYTSESANFNHVLSLEIQKYTRYNVGENGCGVSDSICLNFDLNTGEVLSLQDLFRDGTDGAALVDEALGRKLSEKTMPMERMDEFYYDSGDLALIRPFGGITPDQPFLLQPDGITILLDYRNPEITDASYSTDYYGNRMILSFHDLNGQLAYSEKYRNAGQSLFEKETPVRKQLVEQGWSDRNGEYRKLEENNFVGSLSLYLPTKWPEEMKEKARALVEYDENALKKQADQSVADEYAFYSENIYGETYRGFYQVSRRIENYGKDWGGNTSETKLFHADTLEEASISDLFHENFDYEALITAKLQEQLQNGTSHEEAAYRYKTAEEALAHMDISLQRDGFSMAEKQQIPVFSDKTAKDNNNFTYLYLYIPYEDIGYENMTLFD